MRLSEKNIHPQIDYNQVFSLAMVEQHFAFEIKRGDSVVAPVHITNLVE